MDHRPRVAKPGRTRLVPEGRRCRMPGLLKCDHLVVSTKD